jgi:hypothetical protein
MALKKLPIEGQLLKELIISGNGKDCELTIKTKDEARQVVPRYFQWVSGTVR